MFVPSSFPLPFEPLIFGGSSLDHKYYEKKKSRFQYFHDQILHLRLFIPTFMLLSRLSIFGGSSPDRLLLRIAEGRSVNFFYDQIFYLSLSDFCHFASYFSVYHLFVRKLSKLSDLGMHKMKVEFTNFYNRSVGLSASSF